MLSEEQIDACGFSAAAHVREHGHPQAREGVLQEPEVIGLVYQGNIDSLRRRGSNQVA